jgi:hypothetical protein
VAIENEIPTHLNIRIDPKLRYLTEVAARARHMSLTEYIEDALKQSFNKVSVDEFPELGKEPEVYELSPMQRQEKFRKRRDLVSNPLAEVADRLWSEHPIVRLQLLALSGFEHLMSDEDKRLWKHIYGHGYLMKDGQLDLKLVEKDWVKIRFAALHDARKTKEKGGR